MPSSGTGCCRCCWSHCECAGGRPVVCHAPCLSAAIMTAWMTEPIPGLLWASESGVTHLTPPPPPPPQSNSVPVSQPISGAWHRLHFLTSVCFALRSGKQPALPVSYSFMPLPHAWPVPQRQWKRCAAAFCTRPPAHGAQLLCFFAACAGDVPRSPPARPPSKRSPRAINHEEQEAAVKIQGMIHRSSTGLALCLRCPQIRCAVPDGRRDRIIAPAKLAHLRETQSDTWCPAMVLHAVQAADRAPKKPPVARVMGCDPTSLMAKPKRYTCISSLRTWCLVCVLASRGPGHAWPRMGCT